MAISFNADEVFEMAGEIERNGAKFYRRAAETVTEPRVRQLFFDLAEMEDVHERIFAAMRADLAGTEGADMPFDPEGEAAAYLREYVSGRIFDVKTDPAKLLAGKKTIGDILRMAIGFEKDSIVFYLGISEMLSERAEKDKVNAIIREEMGHITFLSRALEAAA